VLNEGAILFIILIGSVKSENNETIIVDPFEEDADLRYAADKFCNLFILSNPMGKIVIPYKPDW
jgi:hypothetical protein